MEYLTNNQRPIMTEALRKAKIAAEAQQGEPFDIDQATIYYDLCTKMEIDPAKVLGESLTLIDPQEPPTPVIETLTELLKQHPGFNPWSEVIR